MTIFLCISTARCKFDLKYSTPWVFLIVTKLSNFSSNGQTRITAGFCGCRAQAAKKRTKWKKLEAISTEKSWEDQTPTRISASLNSLSWYYFTQYAVVPNYVLCTNSLLFSRVFSLPGRNERWICDELLFRHLSWTDCQAGVPTQAPLSFTTG